MKHGSDAGIGNNHIMEDVLLSPLLLLVWCIFGSCLDHLLLLLGGMASPQSKRDSQSSSSSPHLPPTTPPHQHITNLDSLPVHAYGRRCPLPFKETHAESISYDTIRKNPSRRYNTNCREHYKPAFGWKNKFGFKLFLCWRRRL